MNTQTIRLTALQKFESETMTDILSFLRADNGNTPGLHLDRKEFIELCTKLYSQPDDLGLYSSNGHLSLACYAESPMHGRKYYTIARFNEKDLTDEAISKLGVQESRYFDYYYGLGISIDTRNIYLMSFEEKCSPNWNDEYCSRHIYEISTVDFPVLKSDGVIRYMESALHAALNEMNMAVNNTLVWEETEHGVSMMICNQYGDYKMLADSTVDGLFRTFANDFTGYRDYRHPDAAEWEIVDPAAKDRYKQWSKTATGLKSDFDKFYRGGIVD